MVTVTYYGDILCVISEVVDYNEVISYIKYMFDKGIMYTKTTIYKLRKLFKDTVKPRMLKQTKENSEIIETEKSVKIENIVERTVFAVKKLVYSFTKRKVKSKDAGNNSNKSSDYMNSYYSPKPNLRFNLK